MKRAILFFLALAIFMVPCTALPESVHLGKYNVSFDAGFSSYDIVKDPIKSTETLEGDKYSIYSMNVFNGSNHDLGIAIIGINEYEEDQKFPSNDAAVKTFRSGYIDATTRSIDGVTGIITSTELDNGITVYLAQFHPKFNPERVNVTVISNYPWDEGTLQLLKTIHIAQNTTV